MTATLGAWLAIIGCGGNIGSFLGPLVARIRGVTRITAVDRDTYEAKNLASQDMTRSQVGRAKAVVQARRLRRIDERLAVKAIATPVEEVPWGALRADVLLACVDSRAARRTINGIAWRLNIPWIDAGVNADGLLARVNVHAPGPGRPCLECAWDDSDYAALDVAHPCTGEPTAAPTNAPAALGALAASWQALECEKILAGQWDQVLIARQLVVSAASHRLQVTAFRANPRCRFDHESWKIETIECDPGQFTLSESFELGGGGAEADVGVDGGRGVRVEGQVFVREELTCPSCGAIRAIPLVLLGRLPKKDRICTCGVAMRAAGSHTSEWLRLDGLQAEERRHTLADVGVARGDVISVERGDRITHHQLGRIGGPR